MTSYRKFDYEIEWKKEIDIIEEKEVRKGFVIAEAHFVKECVSEFDAVTCIIDWMQTQHIDSSNLMYCKVEEVFETDFHRNVLMWIGE